MTVVKEKPILKKTGKSVRKKRTADITKYQVAPDHKETVQFQKLLDALPLAVVGVALDGKIQFMNRKARALLGEPDPSLKLEDWPRAFGLYLDDGKVIYPGEKMPLRRALYGETVEDSEEIILRRKGDERGVWISISTETLRDEEGNIDGAIALIRDINYRKQMELSREKHVQRIEALYKLSRDITEVGNNLNKLIHLGVEFTANRLGDLSMLTLLNDAHDKLRVAAFFDLDPTAQALLRKF